MGVFGERIGLITHPDVDQIVVDSARLNARVRALGNQISHDYAETDIHLITVLRGGLFFLTDLARAIDLPLSLDCLAITSYSSAGGQQSPGIRITKDLDDSIRGRHVLVVEDIIDTGLTLGYIRRNLLVREPASLRICTLLDRPYRRIVDIVVDYVGFEIPDAFVVGYGLDWRGRYRNLPYIATLKAEKYV